MTAPATTSLTRPIATLLVMLACATADGRAARAMVADAAPACAGSEAAIVVRAAERTLTLCEGGATRARFAVALGMGGVGKRREGDLRTPLGAYALGAARPSQSFGTFIPVGYPTPAQARAGFTGGAIGIHGPPRAFAGAGFLNTLTDWTAGCVAVGSDAEIERIAAWLRARPAAGVLIE